MPSVNYNDVFNNMTQEEKDRLLELVVKHAEEDMRSFLAEHFPPGWRKRLKFVKIEIIPENEWFGWILGRGVWRD